MPSEQQQFWPHKARLCVSVAMQFEVGGQPISGAGGPITEPIEAGYPDLGTNSFFDYGISGIERIVWGENFSQRANGHTHVVSIDFPYRAALAAF